MWIDDDHVLAVVAVIVAAVVAPRSQEEGIYENLPQWDVGLIDLLAVIDRRRNGKYIWAIQGPATWLLNVAAFDCPHENAVEGGLLVMTIWK